MSFVAGIALSTIGSIGSNLGVNTQKYAFVKNSAQPQHAQKPYYKLPLWWLGMACVVGGSIGDFVALALVAQSIVAPIGSITLVSNVIFAHYWLKEHLTKKDLIATMMIVFGSVMAVIFGDHDEASYTLDDLKHFFGGTLFIVYAILITTFSGAMYFYVVKRVGPLKTTIQEQTLKVTKLQAIDESERNTHQIQQLQHTLDALQGMYEPWTKWHPFALCALSGCFGGNSIMFGKMVAEMISRSIAGDNQMIYFLTWFFIACMLLCVFAQLHFLAMALNIFDALYVVPVFQCFFITVSTLGGACFFNEFRHFGPSQVVLFPIGIIITLLGVYILSKRQMGGGKKKKRIPPAVANAPLGEVVIVIDPETGKKKRVVRRKMRRTVRKVVKKGTQVQGRVVRRRATSQADDTPDVIVSQRPITPMIESNDIDEKSTHMDDMTTPTKSSHLGIPTSGKSAAIATILRSNLDKVQNMGSNIQHKIKAKRYAVLSDDEDVEDNPDLHHMRHGRPSSQHDIYMDDEQLQGVVAEDSVLHDEDDEEEEKQHDDETEQSVVASTTTSPSHSQRSRTYSTSSQQDAVKSEPIIDLEMLNSPIHHTTTTFATSPSTHTQQLQQLLTDAIQDDAPPYSEHDPLPSSSELRLLSQSSQHPLSTPIQRQREHARTLSTHAVTVTSPTLSLTSEDASDTSRSTFVSPNEIPSPFDSLPLRTVSDISYLARPNATSTSTSASTSSTSKSSSSSSSQSKNPR